MLNNFVIMNMKKLTKILILFLIVFTYKLNAQSFTASVNNNTVGQNEPFQVSFEFSGNEVNSLRNFRAPDFKGFTVLSGPNQATSMQIINSSVSASLTYSYYLQAEQTGTFTIGPASVDFKGKNFRTEPIKITVTKGTSSNQSAKKEPANNNAATQNIAENVFIRAVADKQKVLKGEQVTVIYKLYTRLNISTPQVTKLPSYQGFWAEELDMPGTIALTTEVYEGKQYRVGVLKKVALFPSQTGELSVTPFELEIPVALPRQRRRGDIFDEFFNDPFFGQAQTVNYKAKSNTIKINVVPLPAENVPPSFRGAIGNYSLNASIDKNTIKTNEPVNLKLKISGTGNIKLLELPEMKFPAGFETYDPKISDQVSRSGRVSGQKTFEYPVVPRITGQREIPSVEFSYFDLSSKKYVTLRSPSFKIDIKQGDGNYDQSMAGFSKEDVKLLGQDIRFIKTSTSGLSKAGSFAVFGIWFWIVSLLPLFAVTGLVYWKRQNDKLSGNIQLLRYQRAEKLARNQLKAAKKSLDENKHMEFYSGVSLALFGYLESKLHIPKSEFSVERAEVELNKKNVSTEIIEEVKKSVEQCEFARFAPQTDGSVAMHEMYNKAVSLIVELERSLAKK
jgi:hypothetical protein